MMDFEEAKQVFLDRGYIETPNGMIYCAEKWRESCLVISDFLKNMPKE